MSSWSPSSISRGWVIGIAVLYMLVLAYSVLIIGQLLIGVWLGILLGLLYLAWRFVTAIEAIADALQRIARQQEMD